MTFLIKRIHGSDIDPLKISETGNDTFRIGRLSAAAAAGGLGIDLLLSLQVFVCFHAEVVEVAHTVVDGQAGIQEREEV